MLAQFYIDYWNVLLKVPKEGRRSFNIACWYI